MARALLENPEFRRWLEGMHPAWTLLDAPTLTALHRAPSAANSPIVLADDLSDEELASSPVTRAALILIDRASRGDGLKLTATGNLTRAVVAEMVETFEWPDFDPAEQFRLHKVVNEPDFLPLYFVRHMVEIANLVRPVRGALRPTKMGRSAIASANRRRLTATLFHQTFWRANLDYLGRELHGAWPQDHIGVILWSLSASANEWQTIEQLSRLCTIPTPDVMKAKWDSGSMALEARVLRPLHWFGVLEYRGETPEGGRFVTRHFYRKSALFDWFLYFNINLGGAPARLH